MENFDYVILVFRARERDRITFSRIYAYQVRAKEWRSFARAVRKIAYQIDAKSAGPFAPPFARSLAPELTGKRFMFMN